MTSSKKPDNNQGAENSKETNRCGLFSLLSRNSKNTGIKLVRSNILFLLSGVALGYLVANHESIRENTASFADSCCSKVSRKLDNLMLNETLLQNIEFLKQRYSCEIDSDLFNRPPSKEMERGVLILRKALSKYPPDFIKKLKLKFIFEYHDGEDIEFLGTADDFENTITLELSQITEKGDTIQHEIHHIAENESNQCETFCDWIRLNPNTDVYIGDKYHDFSPEKMPKGFFSPYAMKDHREDQAAIIQILYAPSIFPKKEMEKVRKDDVLQNKISKIKEYYYSWSNGKMNEKYWEDLENEKVDENYWDKR